MAAVDWTNLDSAHAQITSWCARIAGAHGWGQPDTDALYAGLQAAYEAADNTAEYLVGAADYVVGLNLPGADGILRTLQSAAETLGIAEISEYQQSAMGIAGGAIAAAASDAVEKVTTAATTANSILGFLTTKTGVTVAAALGGLLWWATHKR